MRLNILPSHCGRCPPDPATLIFALSLSVFVSSEVTADTVPRIVTNFPVTQDDTIKTAFTERVRASFPRDIRTSTLTALLKMDGFTVLSAGESHAATFSNVAFPCITDYILTWAENEQGHVIDMNIEMTHKCV